MHRPAVVLCLSLAAAVLGAQTPTPAPADQMYAAIRSGDPARVGALLQAGADLNMKERRGGATPLMHAAAFGSVDTMRLLIDKGADVNARSAAGATALIWSVNDLAKVRLLLDHGANLNAASESSRTALLVAAMADQSAEIVRLLLSRGANAKAVDGMKTTTLRAAAIGNDSETVRQLIDAGVDVNAADMAGGTPLLAAAANGNLAAVKLLLAKGANVNAVSSDPGQTPLNQVKNGTIALGRLTPLSQAVTFGPVDVVQQLLLAGANVNAKDARGMTPLMLAVTTDHGDPEIVRTLILAGADLRAKSDAGETAMDWAMKSGETPVTAMLRRANAPASPVAAHPLPPAAPVEQRAAVVRSVALLERASGAFFLNGACGACHAQIVTDFAVMTARRHGVAINQEAAGQRANGATAQFGSLASALLERMDGPAVDIQLYTLGSLATANYAPDRATDALVFNVAAQQLRDGRWHIGGNARPPIEDGDFSRTALGVRALKVYELPARADMPDRIAPASAWLRNAKALTTEDLAFRLLGLSWGGADAAALQRSARELLAVQRADSGWAQRPEMTSDAYGDGHRYLRVDRIDCCVADRHRDPAGREIPLVESARRWVVVCAKPIGEVPAVLQRRVPVRARSVDLGDGDGLGDRRARKRTAGRETDLAELSSTLARNVDEKMYS